MAVELVGTANLGGLLVHSVSETSTFDTNIPRHKVEQGFDLADHVEREPIVLKLSGLLVRPTAERVEVGVTKLREMQTKVITYQGRRIYRNMMLHALTLEATSKVMNGYQFTCTLTEIRIAQSSYVDPELAPQVKGVSTTGRKEAENKKQTGVYHTVKKGDTYWGLSQKYGTSIKQLQEWNKYDARKIPNGAKLRVK